MKTLSVYVTVRMAALLLPAVIAAGCHKPSTGEQEKDPAVLLSTMLSHLRQTQPDVQLMVLKNADAKGLFAAVIRRGQDQHIVILESSDSNTGESPAPTAGAYHAAIEAVVPGNPSVFLNPEGFDADGDGTCEIFLRLTENMADRAIVSFVLFSRSSGSWKVFGSPAFQPDLEMRRPILSGGETHLIDVNDMGDWIVLHRSTGVKFLSLEALREGQGPLAPHRFRAVIYRFTPEGFEQDPSWNEGKPFVSTERIYWPGSSTLDLWIKEGYGEKQ